MSLRSLCIVFGCLALAACGSSSHHPKAQDGGADSGASPTQGTKKSDGGANTVDAGSEMLKRVDFKVPDDGGDIAVLTAAGAMVNFKFPPSAAGMSVTLTPELPSAIGWPDDQFEEVIKMEPDGAQFPDPIVVTPMSGDMMMLDFPTDSRKSKAEGLALDSESDGFLLPHFSTLAVVAPAKSCDTGSGWQVASASVSKMNCTDPTFPSYITFSCSSDPYCLTVSAHCCARAGATSCRLTDSQLAISYQPSDGGGNYPYCSATMMTGTDAGTDGGSALDASTSKDGGGQPDASVDAGHDAGTTMDAATQDAATAIDAGQDAGHDSGTQLTPDSGVMHDASVDSGTTGVICQPDMTYACDCVAGVGLGSQLCNPTGTALGPCMCPIVPDSGSQDAGHSLSACDQAGLWTVNGGIAGADLNGVWAYAATDTDVFAVGKAANGAVAAQLNGGTWSSVTLGQAGDSLNALWGITPNTLIAVGSGGKLYGFDGSNWNSLTSPTTNDLFAIWGPDSTHYWIVGANGTAWYWNGDTGGWINNTIVGDANDTVGNLRGIWGQSAGDVWVVNNTSGTSATTHAIYHYANSAWAPVNESVQSYYWQAIWGSTASDIWAVGYNKGSAANYGGTLWGPIPAPIANGSLNGVHSLDGTHVWAVGDGGAIDFWNGTQWSTCMSVTSNSLTAVWPSYTKLWAVGASGTVLTMN